MRPAIGGMYRLGGSHTQQDVLEQLFVDAALKAGSTADVRLCLERVRRSPGDSARALCGFGARAAKRAVVSLRRFCRLNYPGGCAHSRDAFKSDSFARVVTVLWLAMAFSIFAARGRPAHSRRKRSNDWGISGPGRQLLAFTSSFSGACASWDGLLVAISKSNIALRTEGYERLPELAANWYGSTLTHRGPAHGLSSGAKNATRTNSCGDDQCWGSRRNRVSLEPRSSGGNVTGTAYTVARTLSEGAGAAEGGGAERSPCGGGFRIRRILPKPLLSTI
jgi:hypothetical protein